MNPTPPPAGDLRIHDRASLVDYQRSLDCIHCGLCLEHCPTYVQTGREGASPRGRVYLMRALMEERCEATPDVLADLDLCLVCRACETACPSGVRYGEMIAHTRSETRHRSWIRRRMVNLLTHPRLLRLLMASLRLYQRTPLRAVARILPARLRAMEQNLPPIPPRSARRPLERRYRAHGPERGTVAFLEGCVMPLLFGDVNRATIRLLQAAGYDVAVPASQTCCGALHEHDGDLETARALARQNLEAFSDPAFEHVILDSAGCGAALKGYPHLLPDDPRAPSLAAPRTIDFSRFLLDHGEALSFRPATAGPVTYDAPCHLHHAQAETTAPLDLLRRIPNLDLVSLPGAENCCGAAGIYNLDHPEMSAQILDLKLDALEGTGARILLTGNPGCHLQWSQGIRRRRLEVEVQHPAVFLAAHVERQT